MQKNSDESESCSFTRQFIKFQAIFTLKMLILLFILLNKYKIMLQIIQYQKSGLISVEELPAPRCPDNGVLVHNLYSLISTGTEKATIAKAKSSLFKRARRQPEDVKLVLDFIRKEGIISTYKRIKNTLESYKPLGYSSAGEVIESQCPEFQPGDLVACAGAGIANHAEIIAVPKNLTVKLPDGVTPQQACFATLGAIAMQGIRQASPNVGEYVAVIGLGLLGNLTIQILKAAGCHVAGIDIDSRLFATAKSCGCDKTYFSDFSSVPELMEFTRGMGFDAAIITAGTSSNVPVELSMEITRKKGKVVVVGAVGMNIPRTHFYLKEIDLKISSSYGPGRYDPDYETKGIDYPYAYVRWTENRNMQSVLDLIAMGKIAVEKLTSHVFDVEDAADAYALITDEKKESYSGIILKYKTKSNEIAKTIRMTPPVKNSNPAVGFIGLGTFAQNYLLPPLKSANVRMTGVASSTPVNAKNAAERNGFAFCTTDGNEIINDKDVDVIFCATRHDSHAKFVINALKARKPIFVEKPLAVNYNELKEIIETYEEYYTPFMVGFNRRFSRTFKEIRQFIEGRNYPIVIHYRVNAGFIPKTHWVQSEEQGGRIIGEVCHFIDCMVFLTDSLPKQVYARSVSGDNVSEAHHDNVVITITFTDGSLGNIIYTANGGQKMPKEYCEVFASDKSYVMDNFEKITIFDKSTAKTIETGGTKGINEEVGAFLDAVKSGSSFLISPDELFAVTEATFAAVESLKSGTPINLKYLWRKV